MFAGPEVSRLRAEVAGYVAAFDASVISAAHALARRTGTPVAKAAEALRTADDPRHPRHHGG